VIQALVTTAIFELITQLYLESNVRVSNKRSETAIKIKKGPRNCISVTIDVDTCLLCAGRYNMLINYVFVLQTNVGSDQRMSHVVDAVMATGFAAWVGRVELRISDPLFPGSDYTRHAARHVGVQGIFCGCKEQICGQLFTLLYCMHRPIVK